MYIAFRVQQQQSSKSTMSGSTPFLPVTSGCLLSRYCLHAIAAQYSCCSFKTPFEARLTILPKKNEFYANHFFLFREIFVFPIRHTHIFFLEELIKKQKNLCIGLNIQCVLKALCMHHLKPMTHRNTDLYYRTSEVHLLFMCAVRKYSYI